MNLPSHSLQKSRWAVLAMFFINGALFANWVSRIPEIQAKLALSEGGLGIVLLGLAAGVLTALSLAGGLIARYGSRTVTVTGAVLMCLLLPLLGLMPNAVALWLNLFLFGAAMSAMDVAMNAQAVDVERALRKPVMSSFHAGWSVSGVVGAAMGAALASIAMGPFLHFVIAAIVFVLLLVLMAPALLSGDPNAAPEVGGSVFRLPARALWPLGAVAFCAAISEGAMADWSGVYLTSIVGTEAGTAALGFAAFSLMMTVGRLIGDSLTSRFNPVQVVRAGGALAASGLLLAILLPQVIPVLLGFGAVGAGVSTVVPLAFSAAGNKPGIASGAGIAGVATIGYAGFLAGPPIIGLIAELTSLRLALLLVMLLAASLLVTAGALRREQGEAIGIPSVAVE